MMKDRTSTSTQGQRVHGPVSAHAPGSASVGTTVDGPRQLEQGKRIAQLRQAAPESNRTGLPESLKSGIEALSGMDMSGVRVHRNSNKPAALQAHAYAQGSDIHLASGQEKHLPHEAWHVVQQAQGRVRPTMQMAGRTEINDDASLEQEADRMGARALRLGGESPSTTKRVPTSTKTGATPVQRKIGFEFQMLKSKVGLFDSTEAIDPHVDPSSSKHSSVILNSLTGAPKFVVDGLDWKQGANAEYATTQQYDDPETARAAITAIANHAKAYVAASGVHAIDGCQLAVWAPDTAAQPQLNVDVSLGKIGHEDAHRANKPAQVRDDPYLGISGMNTWKPGRTDEYLKQRARVKTALDKRWNNADNFRQDLIGHQGNPLLDTQLGNIPTAAVTALLPLAKAATMSYVSGQLPHSTKLGKDVPILPKVDVSGMVVQMDNLLLSHHVDPDYAVLWGTLEAAANQLIQDSGIADTADRFERDAQGLPTSLTGASAVPVDLAKQTAVMEYRRAKVIPVTAWADFAAQAVTDFTGFDQP